MPCVFGEGDNFTVKAYTDKATYEKTVAFSAPGALQFVSGGFTSFGITGMTRTENVVDEYVLLTNVADLSVGDQIIITNGTDGAVKALGPQSGNFRGEVAIEIASNTITTIPTGVQVITIETGIEANTFALNVGDGYLYAAGGTKDNHLKTQPSIDGNASWSILIENDAAIIKAQGDCTHNWLRYNKTSPRFSCYTGNQEDVYIFHKAGTPKTALETPTGVKAVVEGNEVLVGWNEVSGAASYTVSFEPATIEPRTVLHDDAKAEYSELFEGLDYATDYTVSVVANPADTENYKASAPATATFTTGENPNYQVYTMVGDEANLGEGQYILAVLNETVYLAASNVAEGEPYGYLLPNEVTVENNQIASNTTTNAYAFTLETSGTTGQYYLKDTYGRYMYSTNYAFFNVNASKGDDPSYLWTASLEADGTVNIKNVGNGKWIQYSTQYKNFAAYNSEQGIRPYAFKSNDGSLVPPTPKPILTVSSENVAFAAAGERKEVTYTAENLGENQVFAAVSGENASQFSATVGNGTVTVTAAENTETTAKTATLTLYIAASEGGEHLAEAIVALTQAGVPSGESITYTETFSNFTEAGGSGYNNSGSYASTEIAGLSWSYANCQLNKSGSKFILGKNNANSSLMTSNITDGVSEITINWNAPYTSDKLRMLVYVNDNLVGTLDITATSGDSGQETISGINVSGNAVIKITGAAKVGSKDNRPGITGISWKNNN